MWADAFGTGTTAMEATMRCFNWQNGKLTTGLSLTSDEKLGQIVFLGEQGRGRQFEKIGLDRRNPAEVTNGRVLEASPRKVVLPAGNGKPEKTFYVLERAKANEGWNVLVRVRTLSVYLKNGNGGWSVIAGKPEVLIEGHGAFGDAGRVGSWRDGLIQMKPGDVLSVSPTRAIEGISTFALWVDEEGNPKTATWAEYKNLRAVAKVEALAADPKVGPNALKIAFGQMLAYTYVGRGEIQPGIAVKKGVTGPCVVLGEEGRGRRKTEVPFIGKPPMVPCPYRGEESGASRSIPTVGGWDNPILTCGACGIVMPRTGAPHYDEAHRCPVHPNDGQVLSTLLETGVSILSEKQTPARYNGDKSTVERIYGLTQTMQTEPGIVLVRVQPMTSVHRQYMRTETLRGEPVCLAQGIFAGGDAGATGSVDDTLWVLRPGDAMVIGSGFDKKLRVIENIAGRVQTSTWTDWEIADGKANPAAYVAQGKAPWGHVPAEWIGRIVQIIRSVHEWNGKAQ